MDIDLKAINPIEHWNWTEFCGSEFQIWSNDYENLSLCFQITCLRIPILSLISIVSVYYSAAHLPPILRSNRERFVIHCRLWITGILAVLPVVKIVILLNFSKPLWIYNYMLSALEPFTWILHLCFLLSLKQRLGPTLRGPVLLGSLWTMYVCVYLVNVRTYFIMHMENSDSAQITIQLIISCLEAILLVIYILTLLPSEDVNFKRIPEDDQVTQADDMKTQLLSEYQSFSGYVEPCYLGTASEGTSWISKLLFLWVNPLVKKGLYRCIKTPDDVFDLPEDLTSDALYAKLHAAMIKQQSTLTDDDERTGHDRTQSPVRVSLFKALHSAFGREFYAVGILKFANDITMFVAPLFLNKLILFIEDPDQPVINGYLFASGIFCTSLLGAIFNSQFTYQIEKVGLKLRGSLIAKIYQRLFLLPPASNISVGQIINYISTDIDRIVNACFSFHACWSIPFQLFVTLYLLYTQVGTACIAGVIFSFVLIPINKVLVNKIADLSVSFMSEKDERVEVMTEMIKGIRVIKLNVWEQYFMNKLFGYRENELKYLKSRKYLDAICVYFWATTPVIISILTFATYVLLGGKLDAAVVFTSIALLNMLITPLNAFPFVLNGLTEAWVSMKRVQKLFDTDELNIERYYITMEEKEEEQELSFDYSDMIGNEFLHRRSTTSIYIKNGNFDWQFGHFKLRAINLNIQEGQLIGVHGQTGSGKSSLLAAIIGEIHKISGLVSVKTLEAGFGYVSQTPWIQQCSVRENILFGGLFDPVKYKKVVDACALLEDFRTWPNGDTEIVGEGGATLSGGQKARIALARAVYKEQSIYILDDVLSAVDAHVAAIIFHKCINGLLKHTTRVFVTHNQKFLMYADEVIILKDGAILNKGSPKIVFPDYVPKRETYFSVTRVKSECEQQFDNQTTSATAFMRGISDVAVTQNEEESATGTVAVIVYYRYWKAIGTVLAVAILLSVILMQFSRNATDLWLSVWVSEDASREDNIVLDIINRLFNLKLHATVYFYLTVYAIIGVANSIITICRAFLFAYGGVRAAKRIHVDLVNTIVKARVMFFDTTPLGRIINRFSGDTFTVDDSLPFILNILLAQFFSLLGTLFMTIYGLPWLCLFMAPLLPFYHWLQNQYRLTSRELKRLSSVTLSPLYCHFTETVSGLSTIRAFKNVPRFRRDHQDKLEASQKCKFSSMVASMWLSIRLYFISVTIIGAVCVISILQCKFSIANSAFIGLAFSYALSLVNVLGFVINVFVETEQQMIAMERICEYIQKPELESTDEGEMDTLIPFFWPSQGIIAFSNVSFQYRSDTQMSLRNVSFEILSGEKVGIVGRTGAGKSSLLVCLFRMAEISSGSITIDNVDIRRISLNKLRLQLVIIPQEPFLFSGSIRENVDPYKACDDERLHEVMSQCNLTELVTNLGGIDAQLPNGGSGLSVGERQLFCLARAIIRQARIICIDEATSNVDEETDRKIQEVIRKSFRFSTVLTIAHRVDTVMDCDRILVMGKGEVLENNSPTILLENPKSHFYGLVHNVPRNR